VKVVVDEGHLETFPRDDRRCGTAVVRRDGDSSRQCRCADQHWLGVRDVLAPTNQNRTFAVSRSWQPVSKAIQKLAAGMHAVKSEGMFPYETYYVLATDEEVGRLYERGRAMDEQL
jgi:hypothetical protein